VAIRHRLISRIETSRGDAIDLKLIILEVGEYKVSIFRIMCSLMRREYHGASSHQDLSLPGSVLTPINSKLFSASTRLIGAGWPYSASWCRCMTCGQYLLPILTGFSCQTYRFQQNNLRMSLFIWMHRENDLIRFALMRIWVGCRGVKQSKREYGSSRIKFTKTDVQEVFQWLQRV
jgi:hypothetical protein